MTNPEGGLPDVTLITPTRDRKEAFALCAHWMSRQTYRGNVQWLLVDDGDRPVDMESLGTVASWAALPHWKIEHIRREPSPAVCTLQDNLLAAIEKVAAPLVLIIEDDEHYSPLYVEEMVWRLQNFDLVGECKARYYNVAEQRWGIMDNGKHASLCRTGFRSSLLPAFKTITEFSKTKDDPFIDIRLWKSAQPAPVPEPVVQQMGDRPWAAGAYGKQKPPSAAPQQAPAEPQFLPANTRALLFEGRGISVGIKGMPGRGGIGRAHATNAFTNVDPNWEKLVEWIGPDARHYMEVSRMPVPLPL